MKYPKSNSKVRKDSKDSAQRRKESPPSEEEYGLHLPAGANRRQGASAGLELDELVKCYKSDRPVRVTCIDFSPEDVRVRDVTNDLVEFLEEHRPPGAAVRWINIDGLSNAETIHAIAEKYTLHPLAIEDVMNVPQRPKIEDYPAEGDQPARMFVIARMLQMDGGKLDEEQVSMFIGSSTLLTFQERPGDVWGPIRQRLQVAGSRVRLNDASFLLYSLLDEIVDHFYPILERLSDRLEELEQTVLASPSKETIREVHAVKRELLLLRRAAWPMREAIHDLQREPHPCLSDTTRTYLRDVYDHAVQVIDLIETYREFAGSLADTYMASVSHRMNEVIKVLTILGTIFIPATFLAGVYGMNMPIPEMDSRYTYPLFWIACIAIAAGMLYWFKRRGWLDT